MKTPKDIETALDCHMGITIPLEIEKNDLLEKIKQLEAERDALLDALRTTDMDCAYCKHANICNHLCEDDEFCCSDCKIFALCPCVKCNAQNKCWEWCGLPGDVGGEEHAAD